MKVDPPPQNKSNQISFKDLIAKFKEIKYDKFSGNLIIHIEPTPKWMFSFALGHLVGISGGIDPVNRWQRNLGIACLDLPLDQTFKPTVPREKFVRSSIFAQQAVVEEVLFDIIQFSQNNGDRLDAQIISISSDNITINSRLPLIDIEVVLSRSIQAWQDWLKAGLAEYFPSQFPVANQSHPISDHDDLNWIISTIDGNRSLRSLATYHHQHLLPFTQSIILLLESSSIILSREPKSNINRDHSTSKLKLDLTQPIIACIDDSILVYRHLEQILTQSGYRSFGVQEATKIIPSLIKNKPDLIFLDLLMPILNGYEICEQIRKTPCLKNIPVVILTGKNSFVDRMRSKVVGANGFLTKPIESTSVIKMIDKYLIQRQKLNNLVSTN